MNAVLRFLAAWALILIVRNAVAVPSAYVAIANAERVPADILYAIACAESGRSMPDGRTIPWPWSLNVAGDSKYFQSRAAAHEALTAALKRTSNVDIGLGQINWHWHAGRFTDAWQALDPYSNLRAAARVLREQFERCACDDWWLAVERYHAPSNTDGSRQRRSRYRQSVEQCWQTHAI